MSKLSQQEMDLQIQLSLVAKIRQAAHLYKAAPTEPGSAALQSYVAALERLADHIAAKCRGSELFMQSVDSANVHRNRHHLPQSARPRTGSRVIPFPSASGPTPFTAA